MIAWRNATLTHPARTQPKLPPLGNLGQAFRLVATMGGHLNRGNDGPRCRSPRGCSATASMSGKTAKCGSTSASWTVLIGNGRARLRIVVAGPRPVPGSPRNRRAHEAGRGPRTAGLPYAMPRTLAHVTATLNRRDGGTPLRRAALADDRQAVLHHVMGITPPPRSVRRTVVLRSIPPQAAPRLSVAGSRL